MVTLSTRQETSLIKRTRPTSSKIIFISCEGQVTEEEYFEVISNLFAGIKSKIQFISVMSDVIKTSPESRTEEQISSLGKSQPWQLVEKIDTFKNEKSDIYDFLNHPEDEFWIIADVDNHTNDDNIARWNQTISDCKNKNYGYAISNPFFELWLLLHHLDVNEDDYKYAVTEKHAYEKTSHYRNRLRDDAKSPLKESKHIESIHYDVEKVKGASKRAKALHNNSEEWPHNLGSTMFLLVDKIIEIADSQ